MTFRPVRRAASTAVIGLLLVLPACGSSGPSAADAAQEKLTERVETLRDDVRELQDRVADLEEGGAMGEEVALTDEAADADGDHGAGDHGAATTADAHGAAKSADAHGADAHGADAHAGDAHASAAPHWGYADAEHWGELADEFATCGVGEEQSPIDLTRATPMAIEDAQLAYKPSAATIVDNGHTVQVNLADAGTATIDGRPYQLVQFHFHAPSEHTVDGEHSPVEVHFVHKDAEGNLAVIGVMVLNGVANDSFAPIVAGVPDDQTEVPLAEPIDARALLPQHLMAYRYAGSLTTPPCSEGVTWSVLVEPIRWSPAQVRALSSHFVEPNNRPVQERGDRDLRLDLAAG